MTEASDELERLRRAAENESELLGPILLGFQDRLLRMIRVRLDQRLQARVDAAEVVQEAFLEVSRRLEEYLRDPSVPFYIWVRFLTLQKLAHIRRQHLGVQARDANREVSLFYGSLPQPSAATLAARLVGKLTSPSQAAVKAETKLRLQEALNSMDETDREILTLRHFEYMRNSEAARVLGLKESTTCNRHVRALERLKKILESTGGGV